MSKDREPTEAERRAEKSLFAELERQSKEGSVEFSPPVPDDMSLLIGGEVDSMALIRAVIRSLLNPTEQMLKAFIDNAPMYNLATIKRMEQNGGSSTLGDKQLAEVWKAGIEAASPEIKP